MPQMYYNAMLPVVDVIRLFISFLIIYFIQRMESIKCLDQASWKPTYMKFFSVVIIILTTVGILSDPSFEVTGLALAVGIPLNVIMIYAVYTYVRELEHSFKSCPLSQTDLNIHEFLKFYSLIMVLLLGLAAAAIIGVIMAFIPFPKYVGIQNRINSMQAAMPLTNSLKSTSHRNSQSNSSKKSKK